MKISPVLFLWGTHGNKSVAFSLQGGPSHPTHQGMEIDFHDHPVGQNSEVHEYGLVHAKRWKDISRKNLESFFAILFILGNQKRKDNPQIGSWRIGYWRIL
jgi:hypothetical protein